MYDVVVLGGGPAGYAAAFRSAQLGKSVAMVERDKVGGTCLHRGCIPTKALLHAAEVLDTIREAQTYGITAAEPSVDWEAVQKAKAEPIKKLHAGLSSLVKHRKVDLVEGNGTIGERGAIEVETKGGAQRVEGRQVVLAPGSYARSLPGLDPDGERILTSDDALQIRSIPQSILVIGAGAVGVEFASIFASFGSQVTLVEALDRVVPLEDAELSKELATSFKRRGITVHEDAKVENVDKSDGSVTVTVQTKKGAETIEVECVLVAVGRGAATDGLDLERWSVQTDRGFIVADEHGVAGEGIWAVGDAVAGVPQLAHVGFGLGFAVAERIAGGRPVAVDFERDVVHATYCVPEIASVGLTEQQARDAGYEVQVAKYPFAGNAKAQILRQTRGFLKVVSDADRTVLGVHMIGPRVTELSSEALLAVGWEAAPAEIAALVHPHPTLSEAVGETALAAIGRPFHG